MLATGTHACAAQLDEKDRGIAAAVFMLEPDRKFRFPAK
jgi:hypothetical protein